MQHFNHFNTDLLLNSRFVFQAPGPDVPHPMEVADGPGGLKEGPDVKVAKAEAGIKTVRADIDATPSKEVQAQIKRATDALNNPKTKDFFTDKNVRVEIKGDKITYHCEYKPNDPALKTQDLPLTYGLNEVHSAPGKIMRDWASQTDTADFLQYTNKGDAYMKRAQAKLDQGSYNTLKFMSDEINAGKTDANSGKEYMELWQSAVSTPKGQLATLIANYQDKMTLRVTGTTVATAEGKKKR